MLQLSCQILWEIGWELFNTITSHTSPTIEDLCNIMEDNSHDPLTNYIAVADMFTSGCMPVSYDDMINQLKNTSYDSFGVGGRQWTYQTCTEFGYFQTTDSENQPFGTLVPISYYTDQCRDIFGFDWEPRINETNTHYGALNPETTNVVFVNGDIDPWHSLSVLESSGGIQAILIDGTAHCADMLPPRADDPPSLSKAQKQIGEIIHDWLHP